MKEEENEEKTFEINEEPEAEEQKEAVQETPEQEVEDKEMQELAEELAKEEEGEEAEEEAAAPIDEEKGEEAPEEEKKAEKKEKEEEEEIVEERYYTIPLSKAWIYPKKKRAPRAMRILKSFIVKHMKLEARKPAQGEEEEEFGRLIVSNDVNLRIWSRGIGKPPRNIRIRAAKDKEGNVTVHLAEGD